MDRPQRIVILTRDLPPANRGIGDNAYRLSQMLAGKHEVVIIAEDQGNQRAPEGGRTVFLKDFDKPDFCHRLIDIIKNNTPDWLIIQAGGPFSFQMTRLLPLLRSELEQLKVAVILHERNGYPVEGSVYQKAKLIYTDPHRFWTNHKFSILNLADYVIVGVSSWVKPVQKALSRTRVIFIPLGSNFEDSNSASEAMREKLGIGPAELVIGQFGRGSPGMRWERIVESQLLRMGISFRMLLLGRTAAERSVAMKCKNVLAYGPLSKADVPAYLDTVDISLAFYPDGVSERRTSFMVALQRGIAVLGNLGSATPLDLVAENGRSIQLCSESDPHSLNDVLTPLVQDDYYRKQIAKSGQLLYEQRYAEPIISHHWYNLLGNAHEELSC